MRRVRTMMQAPRRGKGWFSRRAGTTSRRPGVQQAVGYCRFATRRNARQVLTAPRSPWQNAYVERLIGSIRRDCLDHVLVSNKRGLQHESILCSDFGVCRKKLAGPEPGFRLFEFFREREREKFLLSKTYRSLLSAQIQEN